MSRKYSISKNIIKNQYYQNGLYHLIESMSLKCVTTNPVVSMAKLETSNALSELNLIKAQKYQLLTSLLRQKPKTERLEENFLFALTLLNKDSIFRLILLNSLLMNDFEVRADSDKITFDYKDILLRLRRLDFFKVNLHALTNLSLRFYYNMQYNEITNRWLINEVYSKKRF